MPTGFTLIYHERLRQWHLNLCWGDSLLTERKWRFVPVTDEQARKLMEEIENELASVLA